MLGVAALFVIGLASPLVGCGGNDGGDDGSGADGSGANGSGAGSGAGSSTGGSNATGTGAGNPDCPPPMNDEPEPTPSVDHIGGVTVSTLAGSDAAGSTDGTGAAATFDNPVNVVVNPNGNLTVADFEQGMIRTVTPEGNVTTAMSDQTSFARPFGLAYSANGTLHVGTDTNTDANNSSGMGSLWTVDTSVGNASLVFEEIGRPRGLAFAGDTLFMSHPPHHVVQAFDGNELVDLAGQWNCPGFADGTGSEARFYIPYDVDRLPNGDLVLVDAGNHSIRLVTPDGAVSTLAGTGNPGMVDGGLATAQFKAPRAIAVGDDGMIYVSDLGNHRIRRIDVDGNVVQTLAGDGTPGFADGAGESARFFGQEGMDLSPDGTLLYVADGTEGKVGEPFNRIRVIALP